MDETPKHIKELQLKFWLKKTPEERIIHTIHYTEVMRKAFRKYKIENNLPLGDLDPVGEYLKKKSNKKNIQLKLSE